MQVKVALANGKARSHKAPKRAPSLRELSSEARLKEYPARSETTPSVTPSACHLPRRGRSRLQVEVTLVNEKITEIFDFVILVKLFMLTDCTSLEEEGHGAV